MKLIHSKKQFMIINDLKQENHGLKVENMEIQNQFDSYKQSMDGWMIQKQQDMQNEYETEIERLSNMNNDLLQELNDCNQERAHWKYQYNILKEKYEPSMEQYRFESQCNDQKQKSKASIQIPQKSENNKNGNESEEEYDKLVEKIIGTDD